MRPRMLVATPFWNDGSRLRQFGAVALAASLVALSLAVVVGAPGEAAATSPSAYFNAVVADHPIIYYRLGDTGGPAHDSSGNGNDGSYNGNVAFGLGGALVGDPDTAIAMNGGAVTQSGTSLPFGAEPRTLETWVLARQNVPCNSAVDMGSYGVDSPGEQFYVQLADDGGGSEMQLFTGGPTPAASIGLPGSWDDGAYHLMAASYDGNVFTAYMDGQAAGSAVVGALSTVAQAFEFGPGGFMNWDEYAVYPRRARTRPP